MMNPSWRRRRVRIALVEAIVTPAFVLAALSARADCQAAPARAIDGLEKVDSMVSAEFARDSIGSITVGIVAGPGLVWTRSVGFADIRARRPADRNSVYRIASVTKPFTAVMLLQLVAEGRVRLSDPVERFMPEVGGIAARPAGASPFTFLQLATMTGGLEREPETLRPFGTGPVSTWEARLLTALPRTRYASTPGTEFLYSNVGYAILGAALGRVAGVPYTDWQRTRVFAPLGMNRTRFDVDGTIAPDLAVGYEVQEDGAIDDSTAAREVRSGRGYKVPTGGIFTTVDDLARFVAFELSRGPETVLPRSLLDEAFDGLVATDRLMERGYGLGFMALRRDEYSFFGHDGSVAGYRAAMYYDRGMRLGVIVLRNVVGGRQEPERLAVDILAMLAARKRAEIQADIDARFRAQAASPGSDAAVRRLIEELRAGRPDYDRLSPSQARDTRRQLTAQQATIARLGALRSLTFKGVGAAGPNIYQASFANGSLEWRVWMNLDGSVDAFRFR